MTHCNIPSTGTPSVRQITAGNRPVSMDRGESDPPSGLPGSPLQRQALSSKATRLRRSFRRPQQTQTAPEVDSPKSQQSDFKTPTRIPRCRAAGFSGESPHNDSDVQQDIIWDAASPSPSRLGKRGKKQPAGVVDISEIVSRIAPKYGRPKVAEPTLQQWIGDSATIPCTPDVQVPKPKKKSPRPNGVDDLLKLAKRFDFNMFCQDEEEAEDLHQQSLELLSGDGNDFSPSLPGKCDPAAKAAAGADEQLGLDQHMEDDLDFLFDGPTQHVSGSLSQVSSAQPSQVKPSKEAAGKPSASSSAVSTTTTKGAPANDEFEDDWENDDFLNDSLVLEMTQNPQNFTAPQHCSTQKPPSDTNRQRESPDHVPTCTGGAAVSKGDVGRQRRTFKLESDFSVRRIQTDARTISQLDHSSEAAHKDDQQDRCPSRKAVSVEAGSQRPRQTSNTVKSDPLRPEAPAASDLLDDDLLSFSSSDPVWDDPADDHLLCEMCEDLENQIHKPSGPAGHTWSQRAALRPANRTWDTRTQQPANQQPVPQKQPSVIGRASGRAAGSSLAGGFVCNVAAGVQMNTATQVNNSRGLSAPRGNTRQDQFTFKKPHNPVSTVTSEARGQCSAAEIELKKQQAMERRRQRQLAAQNLRAPT